MRSDRFLSTMARFERVVVIAHNNPDPDAIASGWAIHELVSHQLDKPVQLLAGGAVLRAENAHLVELLQPPLELVETIELTDECAAVLVDCSPAARNHLLYEQGLPATAVIDHHDPQGARFRLAYRDIRPHVTACGSIAASYLKEQNVEPDARLATALAYGIATDAANMPMMGRLDHKIMSWLSAFFDYGLYSQVVNAPFSRHTYALMRQAMEKTVVFRDVAFCFLSEGVSPESLSRYADLINQCRELSRSLCASVWQGAAYVCIRTRDSNADAGEMAAQLLAGIGHGGGHQRRAGGKLDLPGEESQETAERLREMLLTRWLRICNVQLTDAEPLILPGTDDSRRGMA